jgi:uncharacterized protein (TIGR02145 family)
MRIFLFSLAFLSLIGMQFARSQSNIAINEAGKEAHPSAILDVNSSKQGFLPPRMTTSQRDSINFPGIGLVIFNTTTSCINFYTGSEWKENCGFCAPLNTISLQSATETDNQTTCINDPIMDISYTSTGATGFSFTGLPKGVVGKWVSNTAKISGTPSESGIFTYNVITVGGCGVISKTGTLKINPMLSISVASSKPTLCEKSPLSDIIHTLKGAVEIGIPIGLPSGISATFKSDSLIISGTPMEHGIFNYNIPVFGNCDTVSATGTINVTPLNSMALTSPIGSNVQSVAPNQSIISITYSTVGGNLVTFNGLPKGVYGSWDGQTATITGAPTELGNYPYTISLTGGCDTAILSGFILVSNSSYSVGTIYCSDVPTAVVEVTNGITGKTWMDRNLGALQASTNLIDSAAFGDLYQWGRRSDGHQCRNSEVTSALSLTHQPAHAKFILTGSTVATGAPFDWLANSNDNLWQGVNGINNPCPKGYRIPTAAELEEERLSWVQAPIMSSNTSLGAMASPLKFPGAGVRSLTAPGQIYSLGTYGAYWSSTIEKANLGFESYYLLFNGVKAEVFFNWRATGQSVRCIKD